MATNPILPIAAIPERVAELSGILRSEIYDLLNAGVLKAKQSGRRTLVLMDSVIRHIESLPAKEYKKGKR